MKEKERFWRVLASLREASERKVAGKRGKEADKQLEGERKREREEKGTVAR